MTRRPSTRRLGFLFALAAAFGAGHLVASPLAHVLTHALQGRHTHLPDGRVVYHREAPPPADSHEPPPAHRNAAPRDHQPDAGRNSATLPASEPRPEQRAAPPAPTDTDREAHPEHDAPETDERSSTGHTGDSTSHFTLLSFTAAPFVHEAGIATLLAEPPRPVARSAPPFELDLATAPRAPPASYGLRGLPRTIGFS